MAKEKILTMLTTHAANAIISEKKEIIKEMEWVPKRTQSNPQWVEYVSACKISSEIREDVMFRAQYRQAKIIAIGEATIELPEQFNAAICVGPHRIFALDTEDTPHTNKRGIGLPFHRKKLVCRTHLHIWTDEGYGYAEPIYPPLNSIESLLEAFFPRANLTFPGDFKHPLQGQQLGLLLL